MNPEQEKRPSDAKRPENAAHNAMLRKVIGICGGLALFGTGVWLEVTSNSDMANACIGWGIAIVFIVAVFS
jgi:uncharacterized membrane protein